MDFPDQTVMIVPAFVVWQMAENPLQLSAALASAQHIHKAISYPKPDVFAYMYFQSETT
jgi:hypothetical protein